MDRYSAKSNLSVRKVLVLKDELKYRPGNMYYPLDDCYPDFMEYITSSYANKTKWNYIRRERYLEPEAPSISRIWSI